MCDYPRLNALILQLTEISPHGSDWWSKSTKNSANILDYNPKQWFNWRTKDGGVYQTNHSQTQCLKAMIDHSHRWCSPHQLTQSFKAGFQLPCSPYPVCRAPCGHSASVLTSQWWGAYCHQAGNPGRAGLRASILWVEAAGPQETWGAQGGTSGQTRVDRTRVRQASRPGCKI